MHEGETMAISVKGAHFSPEVMLMGVRWYLAYPLSTRHIEERMEARGVEVDHATMHRWVITESPLLAEALHRRKRPVWTSWRLDEATLALAETGRPWAFDADSAAFKLATEAYRMHLASLLDPRMAVHTSNIEPLPHQITAVYESMLPRQPLRYVLADDPGAGKISRASSGSRLAACLRRPALKQRSSHLNRSPRAAPAAQAARHQPPVLAVPCGAGLLPAGLAGRWRSGAAGGVGLRRRRPGRCPGGAFPTVLWQNSVVE
jgi:hypothetical protein